MRTYVPILGVQLAGNAILLAMSYYWLGTGESSAWSLLWSLFVAVIVVSLACWLHGATLVYFGMQPDPRTAFRTAGRNLGLLVAAAILIAVLYLLLAKWADFSGQPAFRLASWLALKTRKPVRPAAVARVFGMALWLVRWAIVPVLALPVIAALVQTGWRGITTVRRRGWYWLAAPMLLVCALWLPLRLLGWVPAVRGFSLEMVSFALRAIVAYLCFVMSVVALAWLTVRQFRKTGMDPA